MSQNAPQDYRQQAYEQALKTNGVVEAFDSFLSNIILKNAAKDEQKSHEQEEAISALQGQIQQLKREQDKLIDADDRDHKSIESKQRLIEGKQSEIKALLNTLDMELKRERESRGQQETNRRMGLRTTLSYVILIGLTLFLFIFYTSAMHSAFIRDVAAEIAQGFAGGDGFISESSQRNVAVNIINLDSIKDAYERYNWNGLLFAICAPFLFIAIGFLIHIKKLDYEEYKPWVRNLLRFSPYLIALLLDIFLAYHIVKDVHVAKFNAGLENTAWTAFYFLAKVDFYLIILTGFVGYIIWGIILDFVLEQKKTYEDIRKEKEKECKDQVAVRQQHTSTLEEEIKGLEGQIKERIGAFRQLDQEISSLESEKIQLNKKRPIRQYEVCGYLNESHAGWMVALTDMHRNQNIRNLDNLIQACKLLLDQKQEIVFSQFVQASSNGKVSPQTIVAN